MTDNQKVWTQAKNELVSAIQSLGFPEEFGEIIAKQLGSRKAMDRMTAYLYMVKPRNEELIADEMLAICDDINRWKDKKLTEEANVRDNEMLNLSVQSVKK